MFDVYGMVTDRIIAMLEKGNIPWQRPWTGAGRWAIKRVTGKPYSLLNQFLLGEPGEYMTWHQCKGEGGNVKKGAKSKVVVFFKFLPRPRTNREGQPVLDKQGQPVIDQVPFLQYSNVFHINDCEGLKPKHYEEVMRDFDPIEKAESVILGYVSRSGIGFVHEHQSRAYYTPTEDKVVLPLREQFTGEAEYYSTAFHELTHSTGHTSRMNRFVNGSFMFGSEAYSKEELVAEIGSASILNLLGIETPETFQNNAAYIQNWVKALKNDKKLIVTATGKAAKAIELIMPGAMG